MFLIKTFSYKLIFGTFFILMLVLNSFAEPTKEEKVIRLEDFVEGISSNEQLRLKVKDIMIEDISVKNLFKHIEQTEPSFWEYYFFGEKKLIFSIETDNLEILRRKLRLKSTNRLKVILQDDEVNFWRNWGMDADSRYNKVLEFVVESNPCEDVTRIIYQKIDSILRTRIEDEKLTERKIDIDEVFNTLVKNTLEPYLYNLEDAKKDNPCFKTFNLLKWLRGDKAYGFEISEYDLHEGLRDLLDPVINALEETLSNSKRHNVIVKVIGYTDQVPVNNAINVELDKTGIDKDDWGKVKNPLNIQFSTCNKDYLNGKEPSYISLVNDKVTKFEKINNNCELGAVRAYVATIYLMTKLGQDNFEYSYATGGIDTSDMNNKNDAMKRKVNVELIIKSAK